MTGWIQRLLTGTVDMTKCVVLDRFTDNSSQQSLLTRKSYSDSKRCVANWKSNSILNRNSHSLHSLQVSICTNCNVEVIPLATSKFSERNCCDRKSRATCAQSFALWQQATIEFMCHDHSIIACSRHVYEWCCSSRTSRSWWITHSTQHHRRCCNRISILSKDLKPQQPISNPQIKNKFNIFSYLGGSVIARSGCETQQSGFSGCEVHITRFWFFETTLTTASFAESRRRIPCLKSEQNTSCFLQGMQDFARSFKADIFLAKQRDSAINDRG